MLGVEAHSSLPHDQNDGGNLPSQGQSRHFRPHEHTADIKVDAVINNLALDRLSRIAFHCS
jgi:hypothetical protein